MLFNSPLYALFLAIVFFGHWGLPKRFQNLVLLVASYFFYGWWDWRFLGLILLATLTSFGAAKLLSKPLNHSQRVWTVSIGVGFQLAVLGAFKYADFFVRSLEQASTRLGVTASFPVLNILLPIGISFFTFQTIGYVIDVYRDPTRHEASLRRYALFIAFFPQLVAGPIERAARMLPQFRSPRVFSQSQAFAGLRLILWGLFLKAVIADVAAPGVDTVFSEPEIYSGWTHLYATFAFSFQIYGDFAGYSLIAIGSAKLLGISLMDNFRTPYFSTSPQDFWRRWHISLSTWFRDYIYIPLGGNRRGRIRQFWVTMLTFSLSGLWHGASWNFPFWGAMHGILLSLPWSSRILSWADRWTAARKTVLIIQVFTMFILVSLLWVIFRAESLADSAYILKSIAQIPFNGLDGFTTGIDLFGERLFAAILIMVVIDWIGRNNSIPFDFLARFRTAIRVPVYYAMAILILTQGTFGDEPFIYFQF
jgi:alginate O-acetyltransferase complex protein AlgI